MDWKLLTLAAGLATLAAVNAHADISYHDGASIQRAVSGNSVVGQLSDGTSYCEYHAPNSAVFGRDYEAYAGNWRVANNYICYAYPGYAEDCQRAWLNGDRITYLDANTGAMLSNGVIVDGNICS